MTRFIQCLMLTICMAMLTPVTPCQAAFDHLWMVNYDCTPPGLPGYQVWRIYARFTNPGDRLVGLFGTNASPATISTPQGFYQHSDGGLTAPSSDAIAKSPTLRWDTFCTVGPAVNMNGTDHTVTGGFTELPVTNDTSMFWQVSGGDQGIPDADGMVLILQLTTLGYPNLFCNVQLRYRTGGPAPVLLTLNNVQPVLLPLTAGDVNHDLNVNVDDLLKVINTWGQTGEGIADVTDDGAVNVDDLLVVINHWGYFTGKCG